MEQFGLFHVRIKDLHGADRLVGQAGRTDQIYGNGWEQCKRRRNLSYEPRKWLLLGLRLLKLQECVSAGCVSLTGAVHLLPGLDFFIFVSGSLRTTCRAL
jgi:hypothetical protein